MTSKRNDNEPPPCRYETPNPGIDEMIEAELGNRLREAFSDIFNEPVPERFRELIRALAGGGEP